MFSGRKISVLVLLILPLLLFGFKTKDSCLHLIGQNKEHQENIANSHMANIHQDVPVLNFLGKNFVDLKQILGEPDEQGFGNSPGAHYYMVFSYNEGMMRFYSPDIENKIAVSIVLEAGQEILGAQIGLTFSEIKEIIGTPDFGPEPGMDNLYHMGYFFGPIKDGVPEILLSFSADTINSPTHEAFVKWEGFYLYEESTNLEIAVKNKEIKRR